MLCLVVNYCKKYQWIFAVNKRILKCYKKLCKVKYVLFLSHEKLHKKQSIQYVQTWWEVYNCMFEYENSSKAGCCDNVVPCNMPAVQHSFSRKCETNTDICWENTEQRDKLQIELPHFAALLLFKMKVIKVHKHQSVHIYYYSQ